MRIQKRLSQPLQIVVCALLFVSALSACQSSTMGKIKVHEQTTIACSTGSTTKKGAPKTTNSGGHTADSKKENIVFIGNSLTFTGQIPEALEAIAKWKKNEINVINRTESGYTLADHVKKLQDKQYDEMFQTADIVVFQEYGASGKNTAENLNRLISRFNTDAKFYFLLTEWDINVLREDELKSIKNITYIPSGYVHNKLLESGYNYNQLHFSGDYHPNELYGCISALTVYTVLFDESIEDTPYDFLSISAQGNIYNPSQSYHTTKESITEEFARIKQVVADTVCDFQKKG